MCYQVVCDESVPQIGGIGKVVEIDESKFGKGKSHKGHHIEGQWVFGGICHTDKKNSSYNQYHPEIKKLYFQ